MKKPTSSSTSSSWHIWWRLLRPHTLTASFVPVSVGTVLSLSYGRLDWLLFFAMMVASILIQAATNMFNEYYDYKRGLDTADSVGIGGAIVRDGIPPQKVFNLAIAFCIVAILLGVYICQMTSWILALVGLVSIFIGYVYTGGPFPIAYTPFGELTAGIFMGNFIVLISFYIQTGTVTGKSVFVSIPLAILIAGILLANNIRDRVGDQERGRKTLAIFLGHRGAVRLLTTLFLLAYSWTILGIFLHFTSAWVLIVLLSLPKAVTAIKGFSDSSSPSKMMPAMQATAQTNTLYGLLLTIGLLVDFWL
ncbi:1,4-dihydroxy-2-naphthoate polyprenyltransferase [Mechercharimyces sp. CAU 1602]|uniref:1,4-dihydroxy-2-naphthoate polyprenyltransferase n=1 Tax=Mechercharimyces sp. CAU 1602 TaxID=2973933 RepID=UPI002163BC4E|nr:1,4-dihydroxy-2-naphthoate polyprenyltransferase [Mechercharimyces sp. CAU 1602]MCS1351580.1 1,4-dihydroxy-2-naphthoate polyprenyltransferase [Mechercharimyces sp. CAU 1602]